MPERLPNLSVVKPFREENVFLGGKLFWLPSLCEGRRLGLLQAITELEGPTIPPLFLPSDDSLSNEALALLSLSRYKDILDCMLLGFLGANAGMAISSSSCSAMTSSSYSSSSSLTLPWRAGKGSWLEDRLLCTFVVCFIFATSCFIDGPDTTKVDLGLRFRVSMHGFLTWANLRPPGFTACLTSAAGDSLGDRVDLRSCFLAAVVVAA
jgi:hypothetical protein